jgi:hypothetical protein
MPVHDWSRVPAGIFHHFHLTWLTHLSDALNDGLLPTGIYALAEQQAGRMIPDLLTLQAGDRVAPGGPGPGPVAVADAPPRVGRKVVAGPNATYRARRRSLAIRHASGDRLIALIELLSPANKDRAASVNDFVRKAHAALRHGIHLLVIDLFPPSRHDPEGIQAAIWESLDPDDEVGAGDKPLTLGSYVACEPPEAYLESLAVGDALPEMPLFLDADGYIDVPLEATYELTYRRIPERWRDVLGAAEKPPAK